jgi:transposase
MNGADPRKPTYEELEERVRFLEDLVVKLSNRVEELEKKLASKQPPDKPDPPPFVKAGKKGRKKKPGRLKGHKGISRKKPVESDENIDLHLETCPGCGAGLGSPFDVREHTQEDIVIPRKKVTTYFRYRYRCARCGKIVEAPPAAGEMPGARIGPLAIAWSVMLKQALGLPFGKTARVLEELCGLRVSPGALAQAAQRVAARLQPEMDILRSAIRGSPVVNVDETGWRVGGDNWWLWAFVTKRLALYRAAHSRGSKIIFEELGEDYSGIVIADFFSAYNRLTCEQQKCLVHLLRELREVAKKNKSKEFAAFRKRLKRIIADALRLAARDNLDEDTYERHMLRILDRVHIMDEAGYKDAHCRRLAKRLRTHEQSLFTFLFYPAEVEPDNNRAERAIRPAVVIRKMSGGSRSPAGANVTADLMSLARTCALNGRNFVSYLLDALHHHLCGCQGTVLTAIINS